MAKRKLKHATEVSLARPFVRGAVPERFNAKSLYEQVPVHYTIEYNQDELRGMIREAAVNKSRRRVSGPVTAYVARDQEPTPAGADLVVCQYCGEPPSQHQRVDPSEDGFGSRYVNWRCRRDIQ